MIAQYVIPDFQSTFPFLRGRACEVRMSDAVVVVVVVMMMVMVMMMIMMMMMMTVIMITAKS